jgi:hypothetical protein
VSTMIQGRRGYDRQSEVAATKVVLEGEIAVVDLPRELGIRGSP